MPAPAAIGMSHFRRLLATALLAVVPSACAVRLIAPHDAVLVDKTVQLQEHAETLFLALEDAAMTSDPQDGAYPNYAAAYQQILVLLRVMEVRASTLEQNELTTEQVALLRDSFQKLRQLHREKSEQQPPRELSGDLLATLRLPFVQQIQAILKLQQALRR